jgi:hypothetical protein
MRFVSPVLLSLVLLTAAGCEKTVATLWLCENGRPANIGPDGTPGPCHVQDVQDCSMCATAGTDADVAICLERCDHRCDRLGGVCVPKEPALGDEPVLFWSGLSTEVPPACPGGGQPLGEATYADPLFPSECTCTFEPPGGYCEFPTKFTASTALCYDPSGTFISFDAPASWDGACTSANPLPAGTGARSIMIGPVTMIEGTCPQATIVPNPPPLTWQRVARTCALPQVDGGLCSAGQVCASPSWSPSEFQVCLAKGAEEDCPPSYSASIDPPPIFYIPDKLHDDRQCASCTSVAKPAGSFCTARVSLYTDNACGSLYYLSTIGSDGSSCAQGPIFPALLSKSADTPVYSPGVCSGSSSLTGGVDLNDNNAKVKYCCRGDSSESSP